MMVSKIFRPLYITKPLLKKTMITIIVTMLDNNAIFEFDLASRRKPVISLIL